MSLSSHLEELETKHRNLDNRLGQERKNLATPEETLAQLKKEKLLLKDKINSIRTTAET